MAIKESGENYLETILHLSKNNGAVRSVDIASELNVSKPSVTRAMGVLKNAGFIEQESYGLITLTEAGEKRAKQVANRHKVLSEFFTKVLGVSDETADNDACRIEHVISPETILKIEEHLSKL